MKRSIFLLLLLAVQVHAQSNALFIYGEVGGGLGTGRNFNADLNSLFLKNNIISIGYYAYHQAPVNAPADLYSEPFSNPKYTISAGTFMYGKMLYPANAQLIRLSLKGGLALGTLTSADNYRPDNQPGAISVGNYYYTVFNKPLVGLILAPSMECVATRGFGFRLGVTSILNTYKSTLEINAGMLFGKLRHKLAVTDSKTKE